jgi:hypothetical protein
MASSVTPCSWFRGWAGWGEASCMGTFCTPESSRRGFGVSGASPSVCMVCPKKDADQSGASAAAILSVNEDSGADIELRQRKYLDNIVEQDHRAIKRGAADAWFQVLPLCTHPSCRHRDRAHDQEGATRTPCGPCLVRSVKVLFVRILSSARRPGFTGLRGVSATERRREARAHQHHFDPDPAAVRHRTSTRKSLRRKHLRPSCRQEEVAF